MVINPSDVHITVRIKSVVLQNVIESILRCGAHAGSDKAAALEVRDGIHRRPVVDDIEDTERIHRKNFNSPFRLVIKNRGKVAGNRCDIHIPFYDHRRKFIRCIENLEGIIVVGELAIVGLVHELDKSHRCGSLEGCNSDIDRLRCASRIRGCRFRRSIRQRGRICGSRF